MHFLYKLINRISYPKLLSLTFKRHISSKKPKLAATKKNIFLLLSGLGLTSYYYLFVVPHWLNRRTFIESPKNNDGYGDLYLKEGTKLMKNEEDSRNKFNFIDKVVKQCAPGVFHLLITTSKSTKRNNKKEETSPFVYGSGFIIREDGWALTNAHVVLDNSYISCEMPDGNVFSAEVVDMDANIDVALLKLHTEDKLTALELEKPGIVNVGEWVVALGSPLCLSNSVSVGVVSCANRPAKELGLRNYSMSYIQTDALITFGNSGGPLVNINGKVIGISSLRLTSGISFAIPIEYCLKFLEKCKVFNPSRNDQDKNEEMTFFGLTTVSLTPDILLDLLQQKLTEIPQNIDEGLLIWKVLDDSVAKKIGLAPGDIITHVDGIPVKNAEDLYNMAHTTKEYRELVVIKKTEQKETKLSIPIKTNEYDDKYR